VRFIRRQFKPASQAVIASMLTCFVLLLNVLAASPSLHERFHADAGKAEHQCIVTLFAHGQVDSASGTAPVVFALTWLPTVPAVEISAFSPTIADLPAERGPPVLPAVS
jgi:hypothetical protein